MTSPGPEAAAASASIPDKVLGALPEARRAAGGAEWLRIEVDAPDLQPAAWLCAQPPGAKGYWSDREGSFAMAGVGRADALIGQEAADLPGLMNELRRRLRSAAGTPRYFGGFCFDFGQEPDAEWKAFGRYRFVMPRFEVVRANGRTCFACNLRAGEDADRVRTDLQKVRFDTTLLAPRPLPDLAQRVDQPGRAAWDASVREALRCIRTGQLQKVVLARRTSFATASPVPAADLLSHLRLRTAGSFHYCFQPDAHHAFVGASPERLYRREGREFFTEALAATRRRGATENEDVELGRELAASAKDRLEHQYVVDGIRHSLEPWMADLTWDEAPSLLKLKFNQHLLVRFRGRLKAEVHDANVLAALHPTPAVGGEPRDAAMQFLRDREGFCRGWYAAPIGWIGLDAAQFAVGIRSALVTDSLIHLYSGAGIVDGSDPALEWQEIENKVLDFLDLFAR